MRLLFERIAAKHLDHHLRQFQCDVARGNGFRQEESIAVVAIVSADRGVGNRRAGGGADQLRHVHAQSPLVAQLFGGHAGGREPLRKLAIVRVE
jgi:hypothetical protein